MTTIEAGRQGQPMPNRLVLAVLRSPAHRLLSGRILALRVRGCRSGRILTLPVEYAREGDQLVILPGHAERKRWWRNLEDEPRVSMVLVGRERTGRAVLVRSGSEAFSTAASAYGRRFPRTQPTDEPVLVVLQLDTEPSSGGDQAATHGQR